MYFIVTKLKMVFDDNFKCFLKYKGHIISILLKKHEKLKK